MTLLKIARMGQPVLRRRADEVVADPGDGEVARLVDSMIATMHDASGVGLAAPQIHISWRIIVFKVPADRLETGEPAGPDEVTALINPSFVPESEEQVVGLEGCLSIPGLRGLVPRYAKIRYRGTTPQGGNVEREATGLHARVVQHEIDHLDGILFLDRMSDLRTLVFDSELRHLLTELDKEAEA